MRIPDSGADAISRMRLATESARPTTTVGRSDRPCRRAR